jgi:hypothetical protein
MVSVEDLEDTFITPAVLPIAKQPGKINQIKALDFENYSALQLTIEEVN